MAEARVIHARVAAEDRREQLIDATIEVMKCTGVQSLTLRAIAKEAGASLAAVHYCFRSKEELIHAATKRWLANMLDYAKNVPVEHGLRAAVLQFTSTYWDELVTSPDDVLAQIELVVWTSRQDESLDYGSMVYPGYEEELGTIFEQALIRSNESCSVTTAQLGRALIAIIDGCSLQFLSQPDLPQHRELFEFLVDALLDRLNITSSGPGSGPGPAAGTA